jgi:hypothetical protein
MDNVHKPVILSDIAPSSEPFKLHMLQVLSPDIIKQSAIYMNEIMN